MKKLLGVAAAALGMVASGALAGGPLGVGVPEIRVPEVRTPEIRVPEAPAASEHAEPPAPAADAASPSDAADGSAQRADAVGARSFDSRAAFLDSSAATHLAPDANGGESSVKLLADYTRNGVRCRDYRQLVLIDGRQVKALGTVCLARDGSWGLVPSMGVSGAAPQLEHANIAR